MLIQTLSIYILYVIFIYSTKCDVQSGPDPWNYDVNVISSEVNNDIGDIPPDLREPLKKQTRVEFSNGIDEWFFRRSLAIIMKGGQTKRNDDGSTDVALQMRFNHKQWDTLDGYLKSENPFSKEMLRRSLGYVEDAIYKPTVVDKIVMAWNDYIQMYLMEYKTYITWTLGLSAAVFSLIWLWSRMSHRHLLIVIFIMLYSYEVLISYKEAEEQELNRFVAAMNKCKWYFWSSTCVAPSPDPLVFMKHMNPMKIGIRMFTSLISEPMVVMTATIEKMIHGITAGMWFPFDKITYGILVVFINISIIFFLISIIFNYILNIPFQLGFFGLSVGIMQRSRTIFSSNTTNKDQTPKAEIADRISGATLNKLLDVCSQALTVQSKGNNQRAMLPSSSHAPTIRRSASTGRLPRLTSFENNNIALDGCVRRRQNTPFSHGGSGDAH